MSIERVAPYAVQTASGKVVVMGSGQIAISDITVPSPNIEIFDIASGFWTSGGDFPSLSGGGVGAVTSVKAQLLSTGEIYVYGGLQSVCFYPISTPALFDPDTLTWNTANAASFSVLPGGYDFRPGVGGSVTALSNDRALHTWGSPEGCFIFYPSNLKYASLFDGSEWTPLPNLPEGVIALEHVEIFNEAIITLGGNYCMVEGVFGCQQYATAPFRYLFSYTQKEWNPLDEFNYGSGTRSIFNEELGAFYTLSSQGFYKTQVSPPIDLSELNLTASELTQAKTILDSSTLPNGWTRKGSNQQFIWRDAEAEKQIDIELSPDKSITIKFD